MSVYVDSLRPCIRNKNWRHDESAHLFADSEGELLAFGKKIGLKESWLQRGIMIHFDVTKRARERALFNGAIEVLPEFVVKRMREVRNETSV